MRDLTGNLIDVVKKQGFDILKLSSANQKYTLNGYGLWLTVPM